MTLPPRIAKPSKGMGRWKSKAHRDFVRSHACCHCGSQSAIEVAHVRLGSGAGISQKPDDWRTVSLCKPCHQRQHNIGELTFWRGADVEGLIEAFCKASPKAREIREARNA